MSWNELFEEIRATVPPVTLNVAGELSLGAGVELELRERMLELVPPAELRKFAEEWGPLDDARGEDAASELFCTRCDSDHLAAFHFDSFGPCTFSTYLTLSTLPDGSGVLLWQGDASSFRAIARLEDSRNLTLARECFVRFVSTGGSFFTGQNEVLGLPTNLGVGSCIDEATIVRAVRTMIDQGASDDGMPTYESLLQELEFELEGLSYRERAFRRFEGVTRGPRGAGGEGTTDGSAFDEEEGETPDFPETLKQEIARQWVEFRVEFPKGATP